MNILHISISYLLLKIFHISYFIFHTYCKMHLFFILLPLFTSNTTTFSILLVAFLGVLLGLGIGWLVWGKLIRGLVASFDTVSHELDLLKQHSLATKYGSDGQRELTAEDLYKENNRLNLYIKQMESDRNRILLDLKNTQKKLPSNTMLAQIEAYQDVERERNHLWKQILETKQGEENARLSLAHAETAVAALRNDNLLLEEVIATEMQDLRQKFLKASDGLDSAMQENQRLKSENKELAAEKQFWLTEFGNERKITGALSSQVNQVNKYEV